jgi:deazaflavin-dependent oxidoreductase (nitroreductase family)
MDDELVASGRYARIESTGRRTGQTRAVTVGYVEEPGPDRSVVVAARSESDGWARNLLAEPACRVTIGDRTFAAVAEPLDPPEHGRAIRELILRYGTPSEALGRGPSFRLRPVEGDGR